MINRNAIFKISGNSVISNINYADVEAEDMPNSVRNARSFDSRDDLQHYLHVNHVNHTMMLKCNFDNCAHNGVNKRKVCQYGLYGHFNDGTPFIVENLRLYGNGTNLYYRGVRETLKSHNYVAQNWTRNMVDGEHYKRIKRDMSVPDVKEYYDRGGNHVIETNLTDTKKVAIKRHRQEFYYDYEGWEPFSIPVNSTLGKLITWFIELGYPEPIPNANANTNRNNTMKFPDKRPHYTARQNPAPDRTHAGKRFA